MDLTPLSGAAHFCVGSSILTKTVPFLSPARKCTLWLASPLREYDGKPFAIAPVVRIWSSSKCELFFEGVENEEVVITRSGFWPCAVCLHEEERCRSWIELGCKETS